MRIRRAGSPDAQPAARPELPKATGRWRIPRMRLRRLRDWRISTRLVAVILLLAVLPVTVVSVQSQGALRGALTSAQESALNDTSRNLADQVGATLNKNLSLVEYTAQTDVVRRYAAASPAQGGDFKELATAQVRALQQQDPSFELAALIDLSGRDLINQVRPDKLKDLGTKTSSDYFLAAQEGKTSITSVQNRATIYFSAPVRDDNNVVVAVLALRVGTEALQEILTSGGALSEQQAMIVDDDGVILLHGSDNGRFQGRSIAPLTDEQQESIRKTRRYGNKVEPVAAIGARGFGDAFARGRQVERFTYSLDSTTYFSSMEPVGASPWRVVLTKAESAFIGPVTAQIARNLMIGLAVLVLAAAAGIVVARQLTMPLHELERAARHIASGDYDVRAPIRGGDEIGQVASSVNVMVDRITESARHQVAQNADLQRQIVQLLDEVGSVAEGDLTVEAEVSGDTLGAVADSFNYMVAELRQIIGRVNSTSKQVAVSTDEILATTDVLNRATEQQSARIADTSTAMEEMAVSIQQVSENAAVSAQVARQARDLAGAGASAVTETVQRMVRIRDQVQETGRKIERLGSSSQEIGSIVSIIKDVADQTGVLALNAAIRAAAAGEHGKGFAVVADEVRRLAERTTAASKQIEALVKGIQAETGEAITAMAEGTTEVVAGAQIAAEAGRALARIDQTAEQLAELIEAISLAAEQQARASSGIARAMGEVSVLTTGTTASTQQAAASVAALAALADDLRASVAAFRLDVSAGQPQQSSPDHGSRTTVGVRAASGGVGLVGDDIAGLRRAPEYSGAGVR